MIGRIFLILYVRFSGKRLAAMGYWRTHEPTTSVELDTLRDSFRILFEFYADRLENDQIAYRIAKEIFEN